MRFEGKLRLRVVRPWALAGWAALALVGAALVVLPSRELVRWAGAAAALAGTFAACVVLLWKSWRAERAVDVSADASGLSIDGRQVAAREAITAGVFEPSTEEDPVDRVTLRTRRRRYTILADEARASELLRALGLDPSSSRAEFRAAGLLFSHGMLAFVYLVGAWILTLLLAAIDQSSWAVLAPLVALCFVPRRILVGVDGVFVSWLGLRRFVSYRAIRSVRALPSGVSIELANGRSLFLRTGGLRETGATAGTGAVRRGAFLDHPATIANRILEGMRAFAVARAADDPSVLAPPAGALAEWISRMRSLGSADVAYRSAAIARETLWRIAENPAIDPGVRAGAVLALRTPSEDAERTRLRVAIDAIAEPRVRVALEHAATDEDDADIERALATLVRR